MDRLLPVYGMDPEAMTEEERDQLDAILFDDEEAMVAAGWDPDLHPRDHRGRFIEIGDLVHFFIGTDELTGHVTGIEKNRVAIDTDRGTVRVRPDQVRETIDVRASLGKYEVGTSSKIDPQPWYRQPDGKLSPTLRAGDLADPRKTIETQSEELGYTHDEHVAQIVSSRPGMRESIAREGVLSPVDVEERGDMLWLGDGHHRAYLANDIDPDMQVPVNWEDDFFNPTRQDEVGTRANLAPLTERYQFARGTDGKAHIVKPGYATALDGHQTRETIDPHDSKLPLCPTCMALATAETLRLEDEEVGSKAKLNISPDGGTLDDMPTTDENVSTHTISTYRLGDLQDRVAKLNKRADKLGVEPMTLEVGEPYEVEIYREIGDVFGHRTPTGEFETKVDVTLTGTTPRLEGGWTFLGGVEHHKAGGDLNVIHGDDPRLAKYRTAEPDCEHCHLPRRRAHTVILEDADGNLRQVGRACVKDYLGYHARPDAWLDWQDQVRSISEFDEKVPAGRPTFAADETLALVAATTRVNGFVPKSAYGNTPTADIVVQNLRPRALDDRSGLKELAERVNVTDTDRETAKKVKEWAAKIPADTDNNYLGNLHVVLAQTFFEDRDLGLVASAVSAYQKDAERSAKFRWTKLNGEFVVRGPEAKVGEHIDINKADGSITKATVTKVLPDGYYEVEKYSEAPAAGHWGEVGKRAEFTAKVTNVKAFDGDYGVSYLVKMETPEGNVLTTFSSGEFGRIAEIGATVTAKGTVKEHATFKDAPETKLARVTASKWDWTGTPNEDADEVGTSSALDPTVPLRQGTTFLHANRQVDGEHELGVITALSNGSVGYATPTKLDGWESEQDFGDVVGTVVDEIGTTTGLNVVPDNPKLAVWYEQYPEKVDRLRALDEAYVAHILDTYGTWDTTVNHLPSEGFDPHPDSHDPMIGEVQIDDIAQRLFDEDIISFDEMLRAKGDSPDEFNALLARVASKAREKREAEATAALDDEDRAGVRSLLSNQFYEPMSTPTDPANRIDWEDQDEVGTSSDLSVKSGELPGPSTDVLDPVIDVESAKKISQLTNESELPSYVDFDPDGDATGEFADAQQAWLDRIDEAQGDEDVDADLPLIASAASLWMGMDQNGQSQMSSEMRGLLGRQLGHPLPPGLQDQVDELEERGDENNVIDGLTNYATVLAEAASQTPANHDLFRAIRLDPDVADSIEVGDVIEEPLGSSSRMKGLAAHVAASRGDDPSDADIFSGLYGRDVRQDEVVILHFPPETPALHITPFNEPEPFKWTAQEYLVSGRFKVTGVHREDVERLGFAETEDGQYNDDTGEFESTGGGAWMPITPGDESGALSDLVLTVPAIVVDVEPVGPVVTAAAGKVITYFDQGSLFGRPGTIRAIPRVLRPLTIGL